MAMQMEQMNVKGNKGYPDASQIMGETKGDPSADVSAIKGAPSSDAGAKLIEAFKMVSDFAKNLASQGKPEIADAFKEFIETIQGKAPVEQSEELQGEQPDSQMQDMGNTQNKSAFNPFEAPNRQMKSKSVKVL